MVMAVIHTWPSHGIATRGTTARLLDKHGVEILWGNSVVVLESIAIGVAARRAEFRVGSAVVIRPKQTAAHTAVVTNHGIALSHGVPPLEPPNPRGEAWRSDGRTIR
jgi:hypothetical protein